LNEPEEYEGGEIIVQTPFGEHQAKLKAGDAIVYITEYVHRVAAVAVHQGCFAATRYLSVPTVVLARWRCEQR
jgi:PKHD-type hydroxylase